MVNQKKLSAVFQINLLCFVYICAWIILPAFRNATDSGIFRFVFFAAAGIWFFTSVMVKSNWIDSILPAFLIGVFFFLFVVIYYIFDYGNMQANAFVTPFFIMLCISMGWFYECINNEKVDRILIRTMVICFIITALTTIYNLSINMNVSRLLTSSSTSAAERLYLESRNIGSFDFIYGILILLPMLIVIIKSIKMTKKKLLLNLMIALLIIVCVGLSNFTIAYLFLGISLLLFFVPAKKNLKVRAMIIAVISVISLPIIINVLIYILSVVVDYIPSIMTRNKINGIINLLSGNIRIADLSQRVALVINSISSFISSPFIGIGAYYNSNDIVGGHSQFIDDFARYGLFGATPLLIFFRKFRKHAMKNISTISLKNAYVFSWLYFIMLGLLNPVYGYGILFTVFVIMPTVIRDFQNKNVISTDKKVVLGGSQNEDYVCD